MIRRILTVLMLSFFLLTARAQAMSLNVHEGDLHATVLMIASAGGLNVAVDDSVKGTITITLEDLEPREALEIVAKTKDLKLVEENGVIMITAVYLTNSLMDAYVLPVHYGDAEVYREMIVNTLELEKDDDDDESRRVYHGDGTYTEYRRYSNETKRIENDKRVMVNKDSNAIILYGTQMEYERAKKILDELDVPLKQVSIEAKIVAINKAATKELGVEWFWSTLPQYAEYNPNTTTRGDNTTETTESYYTRRQNEQTGYGVLQFGRVPGTPNLSYEWYFGARLNALITDGKAKMLSKPNIMTVQGHEATINVGSSVPVPRVDVSNSVTTTSIEYKDAGIILRVTPRVNADGSITASIHTEVSTPQYVADLKAYQFHNRSADTTVTMQDGQPIVIGGLIGADEEKSIRKIPFLGDLPILGALFKSVRRNKSDSELVIFLSAHVIDD